VNSGKKSEPADEKGNDNVVVDQPDGIKANQPEIAG